MRSLNTARVLLATTFSEFAEYRAEIIIWMMTGLLPLIMMSIWMQLAEAGPMGGYGPQEFAAYFLIVFLVRQLSPAWVMGQLDREIRLGEMSPKLLRPLNPYWPHLAQHVTGMLMKLPIVVPFVAIGLWLADAYGQIEFPLLPLFLVAVAGGFLIHFNIMYSLGLLAFWTDQAMALESLAFTLMMVFGGALIPLDLFPAALQPYLAYLPYFYVLSFPVEMLLGKISGPDLLTGFAAQAGWIAAILGIQRILWWRGLRRYSAVGA